MSAVGKTDTAVRSNLVGSYSLERGPSAKERILGAAAVASAQNNKKDRLYGRKRPVAVVHRVPAADIQHRIGPRVVAEQVEHRGLACNLRMFPAAGMVAEGTHSAREVAMSLQVASRDTAQREEQPA